MPLADNAELEERDQTRAEDTNQVSSETEDDAGQPDDAYAEADDGVEKIDLLGMEFVKQNEDSQGDGGDPEGEQQRSRWDEERAAAPPSYRSRLHRRPYYGPHRMTGRLAVKFSLH